jgi:TolB protein
MLPDLLFAVAFAASPPAIATPASDIRPAWSPDGSKRYFGTLHPDGRHELMEQSREGDGWSEPRSSALNAGGEVKDFDPFVTADGNVLFFSDRPGGIGGTDLWEAWPNGFLRPIPGVNSAADEWAPALSPDGEWLMFSSDRAAPGKGHRLYAAKLHEGMWTTPEPIDTGSTSGYDFDACFVGTQGSTVVFSRSPDPGRGSVLYIGRFGPIHASIVDIDPLPAPFANDSGYALGCAWHAAEPGLLYVSTALGEAPQRLDIHALPLPQSHVPVR